MSPTTVVVLPVPGGPCRRTTPPAARSDAGDEVSDLYDEASIWPLRRCALLFGSEGSGLSPELLAAADFRVTVAQRGLTQSLNVASCAAILLGEVTRRRSVAGVDTRLSADERAQIEAELLPAGGGALRMHNKAAVKHEMRRNRHALKAQPVYVDEV